MEWVERIRKYFYVRKLKQKLQQQRANRLLLNMEQALYVGLVYDSTEPDNDIIITKLAEELRNAGKKVVVFGYINDKKIDHKGDIRLMNRQNISFSYVPEENAYSQFVDQKFDLLIACFTTENLPLEYVVALSAAKCRVGMYQEGKEYFYELMVKLQPGQGVEDLIRQVKNLLKQIHE